MSARACSPEGAAQEDTGPLAGLNGIVTRRKNRIRLTVNVEMVGQSVSLDVDVAEVEIDD